MDDKKEAKERDSELYSVEVLLNFKMKVHYPHNKK